MTSISFRAALKTSAAVLAIAGASFAVAQGNPPTTTSPNPATGAGQQTQSTPSTQGSTPMGTTGTPAAQGGTTGSGSAASGTTSGSGTMSSTDTTTPRSERMARADRN
jgi:hypothetical protein